MLTLSVDSPRSRLPARSAVVGLAFNSVALKPPHLKSLQLYQEYYNVEEEEQEEEEHEEEKEKKDNNMSKRRSPGNNNVHHNAQTNHLKVQPINSQKARQLTSDDHKKHRKQYLYGIPDGNQNHHQHNCHGKEQNVAHSHPQQQHHRSSAIVIPQNRIMTRSYHTTERMKDSRLNGADLYVARLGRVRKVDQFDSCCPHNNPMVTADEVEHINQSNDEQQLPDSIASSKPKPLTGSLHEELRFPSPSDESNKPTEQPSVSENKRLLTATYSKPCYRCVSYMHSAGIKRVFWTSDEGEWEGGKVRDLVDGLEGPIPLDKNVSTGGAAGAGSIYVTKSEVLMLKGLQ
ncbi:MAG: hypothetical protein Q9181_004880 [Wetmoreana brouardii]